MLYAPAMSLRALLLLLSVFLAGFAHGGDSLESGFAQPPPKARPWVFWFWLDGNISREGITADLEAMARVGVGGAIIMDITHEIPKGPITFFTPEWKALFRHTVEEAARLGLEIGMHNAPGWCGSGGPWVTPNHGMQKLIYSQTNLAGPVRFHGPLPALTKSETAFQPIGTIAFPTIAGDPGAIPSATPTLSASASPKLNLAPLLDRNPETIISLPKPTSRKPQFLQAQFAKPYSAAQLRLTGTSRSGPFHGSLQVSQDGRSFKVVREFMSSGPELDLRFEQISARFFRVVITRSESPAPLLEFSDFQLAPIYRIPAYSTKAGLGRIQKHSPLAQVPTNAVIDINQVIDLKPFIDSQGQLNWDVPQGNWTVFSFGFMPTGRKNHPVRPEASGLESDKLSKEAIEVHFNAFLRELINLAGPAARKAFTLAHIDSWEVGFQNWTPTFRQEFITRRGYDPLPWLPAFTGRFITSPDLSERFLWDVRRTIADLLAENYAGHMATLAHQHGMQLSAQAYGNGPFDNLLYASRVDMPMSEFWAEVDDFARTHFSRSMASAAHVYGKPVVAAEAFTAYPEAAKWSNHPFTLKPLGDGMFCAGVNRFIFHRFAHQPWLRFAPGMTMGQWGIHYDRTETWWEESKAWHQYIARCQFLLQSGLFVADLCYLTDEGAFTEPPAREILDPPLPSGYSYDVAPPDAVLTRMSVQNGRLTLPDGHSYAVLILPQTHAFTPALLRKLKDLIEAGATVYGPRPSRSPSLQNYPQCDDTVEQLAQEIWGKCDGRSITENRLGKGRLVWGRPLTTLLQ
ncbi:MAG TPA: glycosyl hydrolase, partial [Clostridia bacterium]|nr:glycosyl hydrolase [Clostridia bacterium]